MTTHLPSTLLILLMLLGACGGGDGTVAGARPPGEEVQQMLGRWSYQAAFRLPRQFVPDTLDCRVSGARLDIGEPMTPTEYRYEGVTVPSYPWNLTARLSAGTLTCGSDATPIFSVALSNGVADVSRALLCASIRFEVQTPVGRAAVRSGTCGFDELNEVLTTTRMAGFVEATMDMRFRELPLGPRGRFEANKG